MPVNATIRSGAQKNGSPKGKTMKKTIVILSILLMAASAWGKTDRVVIGELFTSVY